MSICGDVKSKLVSANFREFQSGRSIPRCQSLCSILGGSAASDLPRLSQTESCGINARALTAFKELFYFWKHRCVTFTESRAVGDGPACSASLFSKCLLLDFSRLSFDAFWSNPRRQQIFVNIINEALPPDFNTHPSKTPHPVFDDGVEHTNIFVDLDWVSNQVR